MKICFIIGTDDEATLEKDIRMHFLVGHVLGILQHHLTNLVLRFIRFFKSLYSTIRINCFLCSSLNLSVQFNSQQTFLLHHPTHYGLKIEWPWDILWKNEAHFHFDGIVNKHSYPILTETNQLVLPKITLHSTCSGFVWIYCFIQYTQSLSFQSV